MLMETASPIVAARPAELLVQRVDEQAGQGAEGRAADDRHEGDGGDDPGPVDTRDGRRAVRRCGCVCGCGGRLTSRAALSVVWVTWTSIWPAAFAHEWPGGHGSQGSGHLARPGARVRCRPARYQRVGQARPNETDARTQRNRGSHAMGRTSAVPSHIDIDADVGAPDCCSPPARCGCGWRSCWWSSRTRTATATPEVHVVEDWPGQLTLLAISAPVSVLGVGAVRRPARSAGRPPPTSSRSSRCRGPRRGRGRRR